MWPVEAGGASVRAGKIAVPERAVADHGEAVFLAPGEHGVLDGALAQVVKDLIADGTTLAADVAKLFQVGHVEIAHAP